MPPPRPRGPLGRSHPKPGALPRTTELTAGPAHRPGPTGLAGEELEEVGFADKVLNWFSGTAKSTLISILDPLSRVLGKQESPHSIALLKHYVEGSGKPYILETIPAAWQEWIVNKTGAKPGLYKGLNPYNSGIYDLRNSLGHFDVTVAPGKEGKLSYTITDLYQFSYKKMDKAQTGRHGFPLGNISEEKMSFIRLLLPSGEYENPGGFTEKFEINRIGKEVILFIPQQFLEAQGKKFEVKGEFVK